MDTVEAIVAAYDMERIVFGRIIDMGTDVQLCKRIISFWLWLEADGYEDIVKQLCCHDGDQLLAHACAEAEAALSYLNYDPLQSTSPAIIPITARLSGCRSSLHNTIGNRVSVSECISGIFNGVCSVIFKDILEERGLQDDHNNNDNDNNTREEVHRVRTVRKWFRPRREAMKNQQGGGAGSTLNPSAKEWYPWQSRAPDEDRSLFITFSNGYPLTHYQIWQFFTSMYGDCVEKVDVNLPEMRTGVPLFGKVVFSKSSVPALILGNQDQAKFWVHGRPLWCKKYKPKKNINESTSSGSN